MTERHRNGMDVANKTILITGANRGLGRVLVCEALRRGASRNTRRLERQFAVYVPATVANLE